MADKQGALTPTREERRLGWAQPWGGSPLSAVQRMVDEMDRVFDDFGFGRRQWLRPSWPEMGADIWAPDVEVFQKNNELTIPPQRLSGSRQKVIIKR